MRYLPKGKRFFAELCATRADHPIGKFNFSSRLFLCEMLSEDHENPTVRFFCNDTYLDISDSECGIGSLFIYAGNEDGTGFICKDKREEAMRRL